MSCSPRRLHDESSHSTPAKRPLDESSLHSSSSGNHGSFEHAGRSVEVQRVEPRDDKRPSLAPRMPVGSSNCVDHSTSSRSRSEVKQNKDAQNSKVDDWKATADARDVPRVEFQGNNVETDGETDKRADGSGIRVDQRVHADYKGDIKSGKSEVSAIVYKAGECVQELLKSWKEFEAAPDAKTAEPGSPEIAPPGFEKFKSSWPPLPSPNLLVTTTHSLLNAATPEEACCSPTVLEVMDAKINTAPGLPPPSSGSLQQPLLRPPSPITEAEPCTPDTPPPGFEDFKLSRLPPPIQTTYTSSNLIATKAETVKHEEAVLPVPALEAIYVKTDGARSLLPPLESKVEGLMKQPLLRSTTPVVLSEPCSLEMARPGFTPLSVTAHIMPDAAAMKPLAVKLEEAAGPSCQRLSTPLSVTADIMPDAAAMEPLAVKLEEAAGPSWQRLSSPVSVTADIMPDAAVMEPLAVKLEEAAGPSWQRLSNSLSVTAHIMPAAAVMEPLAVKLEEAARPSWQRLPTLSVTAHIMPDAAVMEPLAVKLEEAAGREVQLPDILADMAATESVIGALDEVHHPMPVLGTIKESTSPILSQQLESSSEGLLPQLEPQVNSVKKHAVDTQSDAPATNYMDLKSDETALPLPALQAMDTNMDSATTTLLLSGNGAEGSLPQRQHQPSSPSMQAKPCSLDDLDLLPPPPPPFLNKEMGQMVCGSCRELLAYPRGAVHVQCAGCRTINLVLEAHEVGNVHCGRCKTLLMYPFGAPAVKCSWCLFVTEIGEPNVRPRISVEQVASPHPPELVNQG